MYVFDLLVLFYIIVRYLSIIYHTYTTLQDIPENVRQPYPGNSSPSYGAWTVLKETLAFLNTFTKSEGRGGW